MRTLLAVLLALPFSAAPAFGWGCDGHQIVALIARAHLTPAASAAVDKILSADPISTEHSHFCQDTPTDLMAVTAPWADDQKPIEKTDLWHYVDIPLTVDSGDYRKWCVPIGPYVAGKDRPGCLINAIAYERTVLSDPRSPEKDRATALRYLIHFLGDLSQPLHLSDNYDQGGNCTSFTLPFLNKPTTLHGIWDFDLITHEMQEKKITEMRLAADLDREFSGQWSTWGTAKIDVEGWAWEAHRIAVTVTYGLLNPKIPVAPADAGLADRAACNAGRARVAAMNIPIDQAYRDTALATIHQQLAKAGYRLADLLNETFK
jgi:hypothetical protein